MSTSNLLLALSERDNYIRAEQSVLGAVLLDNKVLDELTHLKPEDFSIPSHELLWKSMLYRYERNEPNDLITITNALQKYGRIEEVGGVQYLVNLSRSCPTAANAKYYADMVMEYSRMRKGLELAEKVKELSLSKDFENNEEYYDALDKLILQYRPDTTGKMKSFAETEEDFFNFLESQTDTVKTGFQRFDEWSNGIGRGWLYILAGRPSIGKTAKALQMAQNMAMRDAGNILIWSQEMTLNQLKARMLSNLSGVNYGRIRKKMLEDHEKKILRDVHKKVNQFPLYVEDSGGVTIEHVRSTARQIQRTKGQIGAIFVDYLTKMDIKQERGQTWSRAVGEVSKKAKWLAQELNCPFIMLAQLSREGAKDEPQLHHLRDSGEIEQDADMVEFLWEADNAQTPNGVIVQSTIAKGRETGTRKFQYLFKGHIQRYEDYK